MQNNIEDTWTLYDRIGHNIPAYDKSEFTEIEKKIIELSTVRKSEVKFNVSPIIGGVPPKGDSTQLRNADTTRLAYHDAMGGILLSTRNAEVNCRIADGVMVSSNVDEHIVNNLLSNVHDKYKLTQIDTRFKYVVFLPGTNLFNTLDWEKINEIMIDYPDAVIKPHPITNDDGLNQLKSKWGDRIIGADVSGMDLLYNAEMLWTTFNSEIGLLAALMKKPFGNLSKWSDVFTMIYSPIYRLFKYKDIEHNFQTIGRFVSAIDSGIVFQWQDDWEIRVEKYFERIDKVSTGMRYPYRG